MDQEKTEVVEPEQKEKKKSKGYALLGNLDSSTRLVGDTHCFILQELMDKAKDLWVGKYYYAWLGDAIRGYAKIVLKTSKSAKKSASVMELLESISSLEKSIKDVGDRLSSEWAKKVEINYARELAEEVVDEKKDE